MKQPKMLYMAKQIFQMGVSKKTYTSIITYIYEICRTYNPQQIKFK